LFFSFAILNPTVGHTMNVLSLFISVLCDADWLFHGESSTRIDVFNPSRACSASPVCTWHCSLHYLFLQETLHSLPHLLLFITFSLFPFLIYFTYFPLLSIRSLSTRIVPLRFQARGRRRRPNLALVCFVLLLCYLYCLVKIYSGVLLYWV